MIDPAERARWFQAYFEAAMRTAPHARGKIPRIVKWARSMSLIAEQFADNDDREGAVPEFVE